MTTILIHLRTPHLVRDAYDAHELVHSFRIQISDFVDNRKVEISESDKQTMQKKDSIVTVPCKIPNGKWEMITFDLAAVRERKTGVFDVPTDIQTSFVGRGTFVTDVQSLTGK